VSTSRTAKRLHWSSAARQRADPGDIRPIGRRPRNLIDPNLPGRHRSKITIRHDRVGHPDQAHPLPVLRGEEGGPGGTQALDLIADNGLTAGDHDYGTRRTPGFRQVLEVLDVPALVPRHRLR
jgi:hypothetical protein